MAARCAVCNGPIAGREFVLHGTEVAHRSPSCVRQLANTIRARHEAELVRLRGLVASLEVDRDHLLATNRADKASLRSRLEAEVNDLRRDNRRLEAAVEAANKARDRARDERDDARNEAAALRRDLSVHVALETTAPPAAPPAAPSAPPPSDPPATVPTASDDSLKRASLLELE